jgi:hypothetical protein
MEKGVDTYHKVHIYLEYHSVCLLVWDPPIPYPASECVPPPSQGGAHSPTTGEGVGVPIRTTGEKT